MSVAAQARRRGRLGSGALRRRASLMGRFSSSVRSVEVWIWQSEASQAWVFHEQAVGGWLDGLAVQPRRRIGGWPETASGPG